MNNKKEFLASVADVIIKDKNTKDVICIAKTLLDSSLQKEIQSKAVHGGYRHKKQWTFNYGVNLKFSFTDCAYKDEYLALNNGSGFIRELQKVFKHKEKVSVIDNSITLADKPLQGSKIYLEDRAGNLTVINATNNLTYKLENNKEDNLLATYLVEKYAETMTINGDSYPGTYEVDVIGQLIVPGGKNKELHIRMFEFQPNGAMTINFKSDDINSPKIEGEALADAFGDNAEIMIIQKEGEIELENVSKLTPTRPIVKLDNKDNKTYKPCIIAIRSGIYKNSIAGFNDLDVKVEDDKTAKINDKNEIEFIKKGNTTVTYTLKSDPSIKTQIEIKCEDDLMK